MNINNLQLQYMSLLKLGLVLLATAFTLTAAAVDVSPNKKRLIAHTMAAYPYENCRPDRPLDTWRSRMKVAASLGLDEMKFSMEVPHRDQIGRFIKLAKEACDIPNFSVSIGIGLPRGEIERDWLSVVEKWCKAAKTTPSIATVNGRPIIWTYVAHCFNREQWKQFIAKLNARGCNPYFVGDFFVMALKNPDQFITEAAPWLEVHDSLFMFFPKVSDEVFETMLKASVEAGKKDSKPHYTVGTIGPGYWRWAKDKMSKNQHYDGTDKYVSYWNFVIKNRDRLNWVHICTWNDYLEHTMNEPTRNSAGIYGELMLYCGSKFKGVKLDRPASYWITAPAELRNGPKGQKEYTYEVRAINLPEGQKATFDITFQNDKEKAIRSESITVTSKKPDYRFEWKPKYNEFGKSRYITMHATVNSENEGKLAGSLPIPIWPVKSNYYLYKRPRSMKLLPPNRIPSQPVIKVEKDGSLTVSPMPDSDNPEYRVDLLYNMYPKGRDGVSTGDACTGKDQLPERGPFDPYYFKRGFRQAALVTRDGRVRWANPVWVNKDLPEIRKDNPFFDLKKITAKGFKPIKINFQPSKIKAPQGYIADTGLEFGDRGNGYYYGWSRDVQAFTRKRGLTPNVLHDTLIPFRYNLSSWTWSIALPNGKYKLKLGLGDQSFPNDQRLLINDKTKLVDPTPKKRGNDDYEVEVEVTENILKLSTPEGKSAAINYLDISPAN